MPLPLAIKTKTSSKLVQHRIAYPRKHTRLRHTCLIYSTINAFMHQNPTDRMSIQAAVPELSTDEVGPRKEESVVAGI